MRGTVVNHLWTMHYKLELVCGRCLCSPQSPQRPYGITVKAASSPGKVTPKRKRGANDISMSD